MTPQTFSAEWLLAQHFPPVRYVVPGIVPEGLTLLVAAPKIGKSWMMLDTAVAVAEGSDALGRIRTGTARPVLYLALEDGPRRLQDRLHALDVTTAPEDLYFATSVPRDDVLAMVGRFMTEHADQQPMVILDTLGKVMPAATAGESDYQRDYRIAGDLKALADSVPGGAVIVVHHTRKASADDFLDSVSGTQGLAGAADTIMLLRRDRGADTGSLAVTSRDAAEGEYQLRLEGRRWVLDGADLTDAAGALIEARAAEGLGERSAEIVALVSRRPDGVRAADVAQALGISADDAGRYLRRAAEADRIVKAARGLYTPVRSVRLSDSGVLDGEPFGHSDTSDTHSRGDYCEHGVTFGARCTRCGGSAVAA